VYTWSMLPNWVIDNEALSAWSTLAGAIATFIAIVIALWQSGRARVDLRRQLEHQNWLEQKKIEEHYLKDMLSAVEKPYVLSQDFYFSMLRLLGPLALGMPKPDGLDDEVRRAMDRFAEVTTEAEGAIGNFLDITGALRELHQKRGEVAAGAQLTDLLTDAEKVVNASGELREWLADPDTVLAIEPGQFFDLPRVVAARDASHAATRGIARRIVRLYESAIPAAEASLLAGKSRGRRGWNSASESLRND
jgi:hypothetical protein